MRVIQLHAWWGLIKCIVLPWQESMSQPRKPIHVCYDYHGKWQPGFSLVWTQHNHRSSANRKNRRMCLIFPRHRSQELIPGNSWSKVIQDLSCDMGTEKNFTSEIMQCWELPLSLHLWKTWWLQSLLWYLAPKSKMSQTNSWYSGWRLFRRLSRAQNSHYEKCSSAMICCTLACISGSIQINGFLLQNH